MKWLVVVLLATVTTISVAGLAVGVYVKSDYANQWQDLIDVGTTKELKA